MKDFITNIMLGFINILLFVLNFSSIRKKIIFHLKVIKIYLEKVECEKYSDCFKLQELISGAPRVLDRDLEYPWIIKNINIKKGRILDVGSTKSQFLIENIKGDIELFAIDINQREADNKIKFIKGDIRETKFQDNYFDCVICVSTLEHIGVPGRYKCDNDPNGDIRAMNEIHRILNPDGILLVTIPYGNIDILPINRLYNKGKVEKLFENFIIKECKYLKYFNKWDLWLEVEEEEASKSKMANRDWYSLALMKAMKKNNL